MTTNLFVIANVKQLRTGGSFFLILLPFFRTYWGVGVLNSAIFDSFHNRVDFGTILEGLRNFRGFEPTPPWYATVCNVCRYLIITRRRFLVRPESSVVDVEACGRLKPSDSERSLSDSSMYVLERLNC